MRKFDYKKELGNDLDNLFKDANLNMLIRSHYKFNTTKLFHHLISFFSLGLLMFISSITLLEVYGTLIGISLLLITYTISVVYYVRTLFKMFKLKNKQVKIYEREIEKYSLELKLHENNSKYHKNKLVTILSVFIISFTLFIFFLTIDIVNKKLTILPILSLMISSIILIVVVFSYNLFRYKKYISLQKKEIKSHENTYNSI